MSEFDEIVTASAEELAEQTEAVKQAALRAGMTREQAIERGRAFAEDTADRRGEHGQAREQRIARAKAYAAWEWDGKPEGSAHLEEHGVAQLETSAAVRNGADAKPEGKKRA